MYIYNYTCARRCGRSTVAIDASDCENPGKRLRAKSSRASVERCGKQNEGQKKKTPRRITKRLSTATGRKRRHINPRCGGERTVELDYYKREFILSDDEYKTRYKYI